MTEEKEKEIQQADLPEQQLDRFTQLMFGANGPRRSFTSPSDSAQTQRSPEQLNSNQNVDYMQLMQQFDDIMGSVQRLKPLLREITPVIDLLKSFKK
ncbi:hypothetical protein EJF36_06080 [Bacillus sp. HMF5848]|uniref:hypothetical protein n=1 Tax=Bacillus sp. HMF5848 TaxID=2495421 RepID=UPI000F773502|nr:hypothetical protein [Bacillus sp. HMF5848]RSK26461.1 hypothetical protein EJF36_06080 [Bacillus sp. HMF5848]